MGGFAHDHAGHEVAEALGAADEASTAARAGACAPRDQRFGLKAKSFHFTAAHQIAMLQFGNERQF